MPVLRRLKPIQNDLLILGALFLLAIAVRAVGIHQEDGDTAIFKRWYGQMMAAGRWHSLSQEIGNYNAPFVYMMLIASLLPGPIVVKLKIIWMVYDVLLAFFTYKLVGLAFPGRWRVQAAGALLMLFVPTIAINASFYGQIDAMWASWALGGVYFLARGKYWWGVALCTVSVAFKPQGVFIFPLIALLILAGKVPWRSLLAIPVTYVLLDVPAFIAGRDPVELLTIYSISRQAHYITDLTYGAPSVYAYFNASADRLPVVKNLGYIFLAALVLGVIYALVARGVRMTTERIVLAATLFAIMVPFFMPGMHERYFFLGDAMIVVLVFFKPRLWWLALVEQASSLICYGPYLFHYSARVFPLTVPATLMLVTMVVVAYHLLRDAVLPPAREDDTATATIPAQANDPDTEVLLASA